MAEYKINVAGLYMAKVKTEVGTSITYDEVQQVAELMGVSVSAKIAEGGLFGNGAKVHSTNKKTNYEIALDMTVLPTEIRSYLEGSTITTAGVEKGTSKDQPRPAAIGWLVEKTNGKRQAIWFPYCIAKPIEEDVKQSEENIVYSTDKLVMTVMEHPGLKRFYTKIDEEVKGVTAEMFTNFFKKVQTTDTIVSA